MYSIKKEKHLKNMAQTSVKKQVAHNIATSL